RRGGRGRARGGEQRERVDHQHDTGRLGESPALDGLVDALGHRAVLQRRLDHLGCADLAVAIDRELDHDTAGERRIAGQAPAVAGADLVDVGPHDAAHDVLVEVALHLGLGHAHHGDGTAPAAAAAAAARATAATPPDEADVPEADRAVSGAAPSATGTDQPEAAHAVGLAHLGAGEAAPDVLVVVGRGERRGEDVVRLGG